MSDVRNSFPIAHFLGVGKRKKHEKTRDASPVHENTVHALEQIVKFSTSCTYLQISRKIDRYQVDRYIDG